MKRFGYEVSVNYDKLYNIIYDKPIEGLQLLIWAEGSEIFDICSIMKKNKLCQIFIWNGRYNTCISALWYDKKSFIEVCEDVGIFYIDPEINNNEVINENI
jgi:hypothetical protein